MDDGRCPQCRRDGPAGELCTSAGCRLRRYHYIPASFVPADAELSANDDDPMLGRVVSDFLVVGVLGSGGFGNVHHVLQLPLRTRPVQGALKRLRPPGAFGSDAREQETLFSRFESEADALASLSHPNIVRLLKAGVDGDTPYLVLELVADAETLERELEDHAREGGTMTDAEILAVTEQTLNALEAAHAQSIVHRDVKPGNIMLQRVAGYDVFVRVLDFGLAKFIDQSSQTQRVMGTLDYMAPEQLRGKDIGPWTDLYALGLVVLTMYTGRSAFSADRAVLVNEKLDAAYDPVRRALGERDVAAERASFLRRATAYDRRHRYANVAAFRRALHEAFAPTTPRDRSRKVVPTRDLLVVPDGELPSSAWPDPSGANVAAIVRIAPADKATADQSKASRLAPKPGGQRPRRGVERTQDQGADPHPTTLQPARDEHAPVARVARPRPEPSSAPPPTPSTAAGGGRWPLLEAVDKSRGRRRAYEPLPSFEPRASAPSHGARPIGGAGPVTARHGEGRSNPKGFFDTVDADDEGKKEP